VCSGRLLSHRRACPCTCFAPPAARKLDAVSPAAAWATPVWRPEQSEARAHHSAQLPHDDAPGLHALAAIHLHAPPLRVAVPPVLRGPTCAAPAPVDARRQAKHAGEVCACRARSRRPCSVPRTSLLVSALNQRGRCRTRQARRVRRLQPAARQVAAAAPQRQATEGACQRHPLRSGYVEPPAARLYSFPVLRPPPSPREPDMALRCTLRLAGMITVRRQTCCVLVCSL